MRVSSSERKSLLGVCFFLSILFSLLIVKFYQIQIIEEKKWSKLANMQHKKIAFEPFRRGSFYSNTAIKKGHPETPQKFVFDVPKWHLFVDPSAFSSKQKKEVLSLLEESLSLKEKDLEKLSYHLNKKCRNRKLLSWLEPSDEEVIMQRWKGYAKKEKLPRNALYFVKDFKRSYPFGSMLGALLHTVQDRKDPKTFQRIPTGGLELKFHEHLKGKIGKKCIHRSTRREMGKAIFLEPPENGGDVHLTINHYLQAISEKALEKGVKRAQAKGGWVVIMQPYTGEILALAQYPFFDVQKYADYFNDPDLEKYTKLRAVTDAIEPGSVFKALTMIMALQGDEERKKVGLDPLFSPENRLRVSSGSFPKTSYKLKDGRKRNYLNMYMAIQKSSNIFPGKWMQKMLEVYGEDWIRNQYIHLFGLGEKTGVEIPAEAKGRVPKPGKIHPNGTLEWSNPTPYTLACGHNILVNSMQMIRIYAMIANGGYFVQPTIIKSLVKKGKVLPLKKAKPEKRLSDPVIKELKKALKFTTKMGGSSPRADIKGYSEAGKSGTSEKIIGGRYSQTKYFGLFCGFAPVDKPEFVMMVVMDEPKKVYIPGIGKNHMGGASAGPVFGEIGEKVLHYLGVMPDDPKNQNWKKETKELGALCQDWNRR